MYWRIQLDVPYSFAVEQGFAKAQYCADFAPDSTLTTNIWRDPATGLVMLRPRIFDGDYDQYAIPLAQFNRAAGVWQEVKRRTAHRPNTGMRLLSAFTNAKSFQSLQIEINIAAAIIAVEAAMQQYDYLQWALESTTSLADDEGFVLAYHFATDEMTRYANVMYIQWDNIGIHVGGAGKLRIYRYTDRNDMNNPNKLVLVSEHDFSAQQEMFNQHGYFLFIPAAPWGLLLHHQPMRMRMQFAGASMEPGVPRSMLVDWPEEEYGTGMYRVLRASPIRIALNPNLGNTLAVYRVRYKASGTFVDGVFDPKYKPSVAPSDVSALALPNGRGTVSASLIKKDQDAAWAVGDQQARMKVQLSTADATYTPFVAGWYCRWNPVFSTRNTTPVVVSTQENGNGDKLMRLEFTYDVQGMREGDAEMLLRSPEAKAVAQRGDATYTVQYSDNGTDWNTAFGGLATDWRLEYEAAVGGWWWRARCKLRDMWWRFEETHLAFESANDGLTVAQAINNVLMASGFPAATPPANLPEVRLPLPPAGAGWRFAPSVGSSGAEMLRQYLAFLRKQWVEWLLLFDWDSQQWVYVKRERSIPEWSWTLFPLEYYDPDEKFWKYVSLSVEVLPPEANVVVVGGVQGTDANTMRILSPPAVNVASLSNPTSPDYLGRTKMVLYEVDGVTNEAEASLMCRRIYDAVAHRRMVAQVELDRYNPSFSPDEYVVVVDANGTQITRGWVKRATVVVDRPLHEKMKLEVDMVWESWL